MMNEIPDFEEAVERFRSLLRDSGHPDKVILVFREDLWQRSPDQIWLRYPPASTNEGLARKVFGEGRARGLIEMTAVAKSGSQIAATVWYPKYAEEEVQGWDKGMKLAIAKPLLQAKAVNELRWGLLRFLPGFRQYQRAAAFIGNRDWAAA